MAPDRGNVQDELTQALTPVVSASDLYLEGVEVSGPPNKRVVRVVVDLIDGPGAVGSDQLSEVSHTISTTMDDVDDLLRGSYVLEVTTPGVSRPLTQLRHFRRAQGRLVTVETATGRYAGRLTDATSDELTLATSAGQTQLPWNEVTSGRIEVELRKSNGHA